MILEGPCAINKGDIYDYVMTTSSTPKQSKKGGCARAKKDLRGLPIQPFVGGFCNSTRLHGPFLITMGAGGMNA